MQNIHAFTNALDHNQFDLAASFLDSNCCYEINATTIIGRDKIMDSYRSNAEWAFATFDELQFESRVDAEGDNFLVTYTDISKHQGINHIYRCQQLLQVDAAGLICKIVHREIPGEKERLQDFEKRVGIVRK